MGDQRESQLKSFDPFKNARPAEFFDADYMFGIPKFDLVIGNPPYVEHKKLKSISRNLKMNYEVYTGSSDLSVYFFEHAINLLKNNGVLSYINTNKFFNTEYGSKLRSFLLKKNIISLVNFEQVPVFENVLVSSCVVLIENSESTSESVRYKSIYRDKEWRAIFLGRPFENYPKIYLQNTEWAFKSDADIKLKSKLESGSTRLADLPGVNIRRGVTTGFDPAFILDEDTKDREGFHDNDLIKPLLKGEHIKRYKVIDSNLWLINSHNGLRRTGLPRVDLPRDYPEIYQYMLRVDEDNNHKVKSRSDQGDVWYNLRNCAFLDEFDKPKIIWPLTADKWGFAYDERKHYLASGSFMLTSPDTDLMFLLGLINSKLMRYYFMHTGVMTAGGAYTLKKATIERLPIKLGEEVSLIARLAREIYDRIAINPEADVANQESQIDTLVYKLYDLTSEEISLVKDAG